MKAEITLSLSFDETDMTEDQIKETLLDSVGYYMDHIEKRLPDVTELGADVKVEE